MLSPPFNLIVLYLILYYLTCNNFFLVVETCVQLGLQGSMRPNFSKTQLDGRFPEALKLTKPGIFKCLSWKGCKTEICCDFSEMNSVCGEFSCLKHLRVNKNLIQNIGESFFTNYPRLEKIDLSYNQLQDLPTSVGPFVRHLSSVNVSHNKMW